MARLRETDALARAGNAAGKDFSEALARGLRVILAFDPGPSGGGTPGLSLSDVARKLDLPRATVRRALLTLAELGYVEEQGRLFSLTARVLSLAGAYIGASEASAILQPACERLAAAHGETFSMAVLDGASAIMIAYARPPSMYLQGGIGLRIPAHCTAVGRVLIAGLPEAARAAFLARDAMVAPTPRTITDRAVVAALLREIAVHGHAIVEDEAELGFRSLAVPVWRRGGRLAFALNVGMPTLRSPIAEARDRFVPLLTAEARRLGEVLL